MPTGVYQHKRGYRTTKPRRKAVHVIGPSIAYLPLTRGLFAIIDAEDAEKCAQWSWGATCSPHDSTVYARASERIADGKVRSFTLHRFLMGFPEVVDHANGNGLHNWKGNLRNADATTNQYNSRKSRNNTSGYKGVCWHPQGWLARTSVGGKRIFCGIHATSEEAFEAVCKTRNTLHGDFVNHGNTP